MLKSAQVIQEETKCILARRNGNTPQEYEQPTPPADLVGLAISGGGIRSATFALGVLEALKEFKLLQRIDYLSTVSGGGYIGAWLSANCQRQPDWFGSDWKDSIRHLRRHSNYLSPNFSLLSADTWSMVMIWLRNTLLLQWMIVMAITCLLLLPRLAVPGIAWGESLVLRLGIGALFVYLMLWISANLKPIKLTEEGGDDYQPPLLIRPIPCWNSSQSMVQFHVLILMLVGLGFSALLWQDADPNRGLFASVLFVFNNSQPFWWFLLLPYLGMVLVSACSCRAYVSSALVAIPATLVLYLLLATTLYWLGQWKSAEWIANGGGDLLAFAWAPTMVLAALVVAINVLIGMQGNGSFEYVREWWSRFGAWLAIYAAAWMAVVVIAFYGPLWAELLYFDGPWKKLSTGWLVTTVSGLLAGKASSTGDEGNALLKQAKTMLVKATPFVFIAGLLIAVSTGLHLTLANFDPDFVASKNSLTGLAHWHLLAAIQSDLVNLFWIFAFCLFCLVILSWRIDINEFSLNAFYRNRLARCYLGASKKPTERKPHDFTGFDRNDDLPLSELVNSQTTPKGPFHLINCALNLGGSSDLGVHTRHSSIFSLSPLHCGSHYQVKRQNGEVISEIGYAKTAEYGGQTPPTLGQAIAVSGAAASPNMGFHTSAPVAFLMTLFNARLGWWFPNPSKTDCKLPSPRDSLGYLLQELFGVADEHSEYLAISDGGHFENLAAYELIKRRCQVIIISDGECDPKLQCESLANLIRMAEVDRLAKITIDLHSIQPQNQSPWSQNRCAIGRIDYSPFAANTRPGWLIYIKAAMTGLEDTAVMQYKANHADFPHESTGDQFYAEDQFESYRVLGKDIAADLFGKLKPEEIDQPSVANIAHLLSDIFSPTLPNQGQFTHHADKLMKIWNQLRQDQDLGFLDDEIFPSDGKTKPDRAVFYKCSEMIQLMENVYMDLDLENTWDHPDNQGWMMLFGNWAKSARMQQTWNISKETYGIRFRSFWQRKLA